MAHDRSSHSSQRRYPPKLREGPRPHGARDIEQTGERLGVISRVAC